MKIIAIAFAAALTGCASTYQTAEGPLTCPFFGSDDPAVNDACLREEYRGYALDEVPEGTEVVVQSPQWIRETCTRLTQRDAVACSAWTDDGFAMIFLPWNYSYDMLRHEVRHVVTRDPDAGHYPQEASR